jgi:hypothetical protein
MVHDVIAYAQGRAAFLDGYSDDLNPYQRGTALYDDWEAGWDHEHSEHFAEVVSDALDIHELRTRPL